MGCGFSYALNFPFFNSDHDIVTNKFTISQNYQVAIYYNCYEVKRYSMTQDFQVTSNPLAQEQSSRSWSFKEFF